MGPVLTVKCPERALGAQNENSTKFKSLPEYSGVGLKNGSPVLGPFCGPKQAERDNFQNFWVDFGQILAVFRPDDSWGSEFCFFIFKLGVQIQKKKLNIF